MALTLKCRAVANYIIEEINKFNDGKKIQEQVSMTTKRLQKLLYFCEAEYMKRNRGRILFEDEFYAWPSGPVIPALYHEFVRCQNGEMLSEDKKDETVLSDDVKNIIVQIFDATRDLDTLDLVNISIIDGSPHSKVFEEDDKDHLQVISKKDTYSYYSNREVLPQLKVDGESVKKIYKDRKIDIEAKLFMLLLHLKEDTQKVYSSKEGAKNVAYVFSDYNEFKTYFLENGFPEISNDLLELCIMKITKKGKIIALKALCDYAITKHNLSKLGNAELSIDEEQQFGAAGCRTFVVQPKKHMILRK